MTFQTRICGSCLQRRSSDFCWDNLMRRWVCGECREDEADTVELHRPLAPNETRHAPTALCGERGPHATWDCQEWGRCAPADAAHRQRVYDHGPDGDASTPGFLHRD